MGKSRKNRTHRKINRSLSIAKKMFGSEYNSGRYQTYHFAFIFQKNKLISTGINNPIKPNAKASYFGYKFGIKKYQKYSFLHAEIDAIAKCWGKTYLDKSYSMIIIRINSYGEIKNSKPCDDCSYILDSLNIIDIWWSNNFGEITNGEILCPVGKFEASCSGRNGNGSLSCVHGADF